MIGKLTLRRIIIIGLVCSAVVIGASGISATEQMTIDRVRARALEHNRSYLSALEDEVQAEQEIRSTVADALPEIRFDGSYTRNFLIPSFFLTATNEAGNDETIEFQTGFKNNFRGSLSLKQPLWHGNKVYTALHVAKLYRKYAQAVSEQVRAEVIYQADLLFYAIGWRKSDLDAIRSEHSALTRNYEVVSSRQGQGMASEFELLQAVVQRDNLLPRIIAAESELGLAKARLKSWLGFDLKEEVEFIVGNTLSSEANLPSLEQLTQVALEKRPEVLQADYSIDISRRAIKIARGEYYPHFDAIAAYDWSSQSDEFSLSNNTSKSWTAGLQISFPLFEGFRTKADVSKRKAQYSQARLAKSEAVDKISLQVTQSYDRLVQAKKSLEIQTGTIARAEEGLRIANLRYESGVGTQLEVLSAQAALSGARGAYSLALFGLRQARASLKKATTVDYEVENRL